MEVDDDFAERSARYLDWLKASDAVVTEKIHIADLREQNAGRGVVAGADIETDEELFSIPRNLILSVENSAFAAQHAELLQLLEGDVWLELILVMLYENSRGRESKWKAYFDVLPTAGEFDTLMYWDQAELEELEASAVVHKIGKQKSDEMFQEKIWPIVKAQPTLFGLKDDVTETQVLLQAHHMGSLIMAYGFDIESAREREIDEEGYVSDEEDESLPKGMVPLADTLNADGDRNNARLFHEPHALVMKAIKPISKGVEIFNDYGPLPRADLLRRYGYVSDNYAKYDLVELSSHMILSTATTELKLSEADMAQRIGCLEAFGEELEEGYDVSRADPDEDPMDMFPPPLKLLIALLVMPTASIPPLSKPSKLEKLVAKKEFPTAWHHLLLSILIQRESQYKDSVEEDRKRLDVYRQRVASGMWLTNSRDSRRKIMAISVRLGEKEVLQHAINVLREKAGVGSADKRKAEVVSNGGGSSGRSTPKRTKR